MRNPWGQRLRAPPSRATKLDSTKAGRRALIIARHGMPPRLRRLLHRPVDQLATARPARRQAGGGALPTPGCRMALHAFRAAGPSTGLHQPPAKPGDVRQQQRACAYVPASAGDPPPARARPLTPPVARPSRRPRPCALWAAGPVRTQAKKSGPDGPARRCAFTTPGRADGTSRSPTAHHQVPEGRFNHRRRPASRLGNAEPPTIPRSGIPPLRLTDRVRRMLRPNRPSADPACRAKSPT